MGETKPDGASKNVETTTRVEARKSASEKIKEISKAIVERALELHGSDPESNERILKLLSDPPPEGGVGAIDVEIQKLGGSQPPNNSEAVASLLRQAWLTSIRPFEKHRPQ